MKKNSKTYSKHIYGLASKQMNGSLYSKRVSQFLESLVQLPINTTVNIIFQALSGYVDFLRNNKQLNQSYPDILSTPDPLLSDFELALDSTIKENKYQRLSVFTEMKENVELTSSILEVANQLHSKDAIDFMGELAGAWILTYPIDAIRKFEDVLLPIDWAKDEKDYIYILRRHFDIEAEEWRR